MRSMFLLAVVVLFVAGCSVGGDSPTDPFESGPVLRQSNLVGDGDTSGDLCGGLSPCDAFNYGHSGTGFSGMCFLPPTVDNHLSDDACSGQFVRGLVGFQLIWCRVVYHTVDDILDGETAPHIAHVNDEPDNSLDCGEPQDLVEDGNAEHYSTSVRFRRRGPEARNVDDVFRLYIVRAGVRVAHRDVILNPNLTTPADGFVHAIGFGNEPIKIRIAEGSGCVESGNLATCWVAGVQTVSLGADDVTVRFDFGAGNPTFLADFDVSECLSLGFDFDGTTPTGNALVDVPLAGCKVSLSSQQLDELTEPAEISFDVVDARWDSGVFAVARLNVIQVDQAGVSVLPRTNAQPWFGMALTASSIAPLRWIGRGLVRLAALFRPTPLYAEIGAGEGWDFTRMSDFQVALMPVMDHDAMQHPTGIACGSGLDSCLDLGAFPSSGSVPVSVKVSAPGNTADAIPFSVPDTRLHFFPANGSTVHCPTGTEGPIGPYGRGCYGMDVLDYSTDPPSDWGHLVVVTGEDGTGSVDWEDLADGANTLNVSACGVARPGNIEANPPDTVGDGVWGTLGNCTDRRAAMTAGGAIDNGPADGFTPFEPVDTDNEVAIYGLPLTFEAQTCPTITVDGVKGNGVNDFAEWEACADMMVYTVPLKGKKTTDNARVYTYDDGETLYVALEVQTDDLGGKIFMNLVENGGGLDQGVGDDLLVLEFDGTATGTFADWHFSQHCVDNNSSSLCGDPDTVSDTVLTGPDAGDYSADAKATVGGAGRGTVFYEFSRPLGSPNRFKTDDDEHPKEDLNAPKGANVGLRITVTQGKGGGKGGFVIPDPKDGAAYHVFTIR